MTGSSRRDEAQTKPVATPANQSNRSDWPRIIRRAATVGLVVWLITVTIVTIVTFLLPESYQAAARVRVERVGSPLSTQRDGLTILVYDPYFMQTEFEIIKSQLVLEPVIQQLNLEKRWSDRQAAGQKLGLAETLHRLKSRIELKPVRGATLIDIGARSESRDEAAEVANAITESYVNYRSTRQLAINDQRQPTSSDTNRLASAQLLCRVLIVETARPPLHPTRPNRPLNIALGAVAALFLGGIAAFISGMIAWRKRRRHVTYP